MKEKKEKTHLDTQTDKGRSWGILQNKMGELQNKMGKITKVVGYLYKIPYRKY